MKNINNKLSEIDGIDTKTKEGSFRYRTYQTSIDSDIYSDMGQSYSNFNRGIFVTSNTNRFYETVNSNYYSNSIKNGSDESEIQNQGGYFYLYNRSSGVYQNQISMSQYDLNIEHRGSTFSDRCGIYMNASYQMSLYAKSDINITTLTKFNVITQDTIMLKKQISSVDNSSISIASNGDILLTNKTKITNVVNNGLASTIVEQNSTDFTATTENTYLYSSNQIEIDAPTIIMSNIKYGATTFTFDGVQSTFIIPHGLGSTPTSMALTFSDGGYVDFISGTRSFNSTNITIDCDSTPSGGSIIVYWQVYK